MMSNTKNTPLPSGRGHKQKKHRTSRVLSSGSLWVARRGRWSDVVAGDIPRPPTLYDNSGDNYEPPTVSDSKTLESKYFLIFLVVCTLDIWCVLARSTLYFLYLLLPQRVMFSYVNKSSTSTESDVFICEQVMDTPAPESETASVLPQDCGRPPRTQHSCGSRAGTLCCS